MISVHELSPPRRKRFLFFLSHPNPYPFERLSSCLFGVYVLVCYQNGKINQKWQVKTQEFGKEGFAHQTHWAINDPSHCGLAPPPFSAGLVSLVHCSSKGNRFFAPLTLPCCERIMVQDKPTPLKLGLCIHDWIISYLSLCLSRQLNLTSMCVRCLVMPICVCDSQTKKCVRDLWRWHLVSIS